jgi:hypothetical protein
VAAAENKTFLSPEIGMTISIVFTYHIVEHWHTFLHLVDLVPHPAVRLVVIFIDNAGLVWGETFNL